MSAAGKAGSERPEKRSFSIEGHRTSISLERQFWEALKDAAAQEGVSLAALVARIDAGRGGAGLSSAVRIWILGYFRLARSKTSYDGGNRD
jgi:predicted DNA-binding ribbon-helix-helix protein